MVLFIDGNQDYVLQGLPWRKNHPRKLLPGKAYAEWHGCRAALVDKGGPERPARYCVSGSDAVQCRVAAKRLGIWWEMEGQYGPVFPGPGGFDPGLVAKAKTLLELR